MERPHGHRSDGVMPTISIEHLGLGVEDGTGEGSDWVRAGPDLASNTPATGAPTISGAAQVGETLTANTSGIADEDGKANASFDYQWLADDSDIAGATGSTYTPVDGDAGKAIKVRVSYTDDAGTTETLTSEATAAVAARPNTPATGTPTIGGTAQVGETLTADTSGIADADGLTGVAFTYQWIRNDGTADTDIFGATGETYTPVPVDEGKAIKVRVSFTDDAGNEEALTTLRLGGNQLTGCVPASLKAIENNDIEDLGLEVCTDS